MGSPTTTGPETRSPEPELPPQTREALKRPGADLTQDGLTKAKIRLINELIKGNAPFNELCTLAKTGPTGIVPSLDLNKQTDCYIASCVINLSDTEIDKTTAETLNLGLSFCPTPTEPNLFELHQDLETFFRRLRLRQFFYEEDPPEAQPESPLDRFKPKSNWTPPPNQDQILDTFINLVRRDAHKATPKWNHQQNLNRKQRRCLKRLYQNHDLVVKKGDKGSAFVIMNTIDYARECYRQLCQEKTYEFTKEDLTEQHNLEVTALLTKMRDAKAITEKNFKGLVNHTPRTPKFYILPKIHKKGIAGRPILSGNGGPTEKISALVDECIKRYVPKLPSHIKDTTDFINHIEALKDIPPDALLVTLDVTSLYTNIPNEEGIRAVLEYVLHDRERTLEARWIRDLLKLVLYKNNFEFNGHHFLQIGGTAMGTKVAPSLANLFMGKLEKDLIKDWPDKPLVWFRFIDDVFCVWTHGQERLGHFLDHLNQAHRTIKFTMESSHTQVNFLDTTVYKHGNTLRVKLYTKPTDTHSYLHHKSCHPAQCLTKGPFGQYLRLKRNNSNTEHYQSSARTLTKHYLKRGYPLPDLQRNRDKADALQRTDLLKKRTTQKQREIIPMITTYNPCNPDLRHIIRQHWPLLKHTEVNWLQDSKPIFGHRRCPNLKDQLVRAKLVYPPKQAGKIGKIILNPPTECIRSPCNICPILNRENTAFSSYNDSYYKLQQATRTASCETRNLVYLLTCTRCRQQYVGETKRTLRVRLTEHYADIRHDRDSPVARHFNQKGHSHRDISPKILEIILKDPESEPARTIRKKTEMSWIYKLQSLSPNGINILG